MSTTDVLTKYLNEESKDSKVFVHGVAAPL